MKKTNKGFSMVELIIVIAIMAILAGALAPALIKYINKSRVSADISTAQTVAKAFQTALSNEAAYTAADASYANKLSTIMGTKNSFTDEVKNGLGGTVPAAKATKDVNGNKFNAKGDFYVTVDTKNSKVEVFLESSANANYQAYPVTGPSLAY